MQHTRRKKLTYYCFFYVTHKKCGIPILLLGFSAAHREHVIPALLLFHSLRVNPFVTAACDMTVGDLCVDLELICLTNVIKCIVEHYNETTNDVYG